MSQEKTTPNSINLWEQWLQRLSVAPTPAFQNIHQLELLEFISQANLESEQSLCRLGTLMIHAFPVGTMIIYNPQENQRPIFFSQLKKEFGQFKHLLRINRLKNSFEQRKIRLRVQVNGVVNNFGYLYEFSLKIPDKPSLIMSFFCQRPFSVEDLKLLNIITELVILRLKQAQTEKYYLAEKDRFSTLSHRLSEGLVILDQQQIIRLWNRPMQNITGYTPKDSIGKSLTQLIKRPDNPDWLTSFQKEFQDVPMHNVFTAEFGITTRYKQTRWLRFSGSFLRGADGTAEQTIILVHDRSHDHLLEQQKNDFISITTHELRTPITAIRGYLAFLAKDSQNFTPKQQHHLSRASSACDRLVNLAEEILEVTRLEQNRHVFNQTKVNLHEVAAKVVADLQGKAKLKNIPVTLKRPEFEPLIIADQLRVEQVLANLIDNALKYTLEGQIVVRFELQEKNNQQRVVTVVDDTGIGMSSSELKTVFNKFQRTESAQKTGETGAGLGLFIAKTFVEKMGGEIGAVSRPRRGTKFSVSFPLMEEPALKIAAKK